MSLTTDPHHLGAEEGGLGSRAFSSIEAHDFRAEEWLRHHHPRVLPSGGAVFRDLDIEPHGIFKAVVQGGHTQAVLQLDRSGEPAAVYPLLPEEKRDIIPRVGLRIVAALARHNIGGCQALDLGSGDFALFALYAVQHGASQAIGVELDVSKAANARKVTGAVTPFVEIVQGNWFQPLVDRRFDLIISNPPYLPESAGGLLISDGGGLDGRLHADHIIQHASSFLNARGRLVMHLPAFFGVSEETAGERSLCSLMSLAGLEPTLLEEFWIPASRDFERALPLITQLYPGSLDCFVQLEGHIAYKSVLIEGRRPS